MIKPCVVCRSVGAPDSEPSLCPECIAYTVGRRAANIQIVDDHELTFDEVNALVPGMLDPVGDANIMDVMAFYVTDMGHLVMLSKQSGLPYVWAQTDVDTWTWMSWTRYIADYE